MTKKVLIVEDDLGIVDLLKIHLSDLNCEVVYRHNGKEGQELALSEPFDLYILDVMLPEVDGIEICRSIRSSGIQKPIMMLTAKSDEIDKVLGLETGADDYLTKPFGVREFISRIKALFRRSEIYAGMVKEAQGELITSAGLEIEVAKRKVVVNGDAIELTPKEFDLLMLLVRHPGRSYSREQLLTQVWGYEFNGYEHTVNSHINRLRAKIEPDISKPTYVLTTWGVGYRFNDEI